MYLPYVIEQAINSIRKEYRTRPCKLHPDEEEWSVKFHAGIREMRNRHKQRIVELLSELDVIRIEMDAERMQIEDEMSRACAKFHAARVGEKDHA
jgi:hypothetical protein